MKNLTDYNSRSFIRNKKYSHYFSFRRKDAIIKNIEFIVGAIIAIIVVAGIYELF